MKLGFDIHGVIDVKPKEFSLLTNKLKSMGHEIYIITGPKINSPYRTRRGGNYKNVKDELQSHRIVYDKLDSVLDYHVDKGTQMWKSRGNWWLDEDIWNDTKGIMCNDIDIDLHIDDSLSYKDNFKTPFGFVDNENNSIKISGVVDEEIISLYKDILSYDIILL